MSTSTGNGSHRVHLARDPLGLTLCGLVAAHVTHRPRWSQSVTTPAVPSSLRCAHCRRVLRWRDRRPR